jgi:hypothetical protein
VATSAAAQSKSKLSHALRSRARPTFALCFGGQVSRRAGHCVARARDLLSPVACPIYGAASASPKLTG